MNLKSIMFATVERGKTLNTETLDYPLVEAAYHAETNGFSLLRPFPTGTAGQTKWEKSRIHEVVSRHRYLLNLFQGLTCKPVREPKLYYTDTSFDAIGRVSQSLLGGRGLTYFFLTRCLPFPIFCN